MSQRDERALSQLKSQRAAAINGILFSLLSMTVMFIVQDFVTVTSADIRTYLKNVFWLNLFVGAPL